MGKRSAKILVIDDERPICYSCKVILEAESHRVDYVTSGVEGAERAIKGDYEVVLLDLKMPDLPGMEVLTRIKDQRPDVAVVIITGYATIRTSIEAIQKGAHDYVPKPFTPDELSVTVDKVLQSLALARENEALRVENKLLRGDTRFLGRSKKAEEIRRQIVKVAPTDFTVTIYGESGTGKEVVAREIYEHSSRTDGPFVAVDVSALSPNLVESELFGHVKGAFTGAGRTRPGCFSRAHGGTLFLDEISNVSREIQGKLLRVLETHRVRPVGADDEVAVDVRLIAATNRDLHAMVEAGTFREDLYYRLNVIPLTLPPLRERSDDIPLLATHFFKRAQAHEDTSVVRGFTTEAMARLISYPWPGNVRELRNVVDRMVATVEEPLVRVEHLPPELLGQLSLPPDVYGGSAPKTAQALKAEKRRVKDLAVGRVEREFVLQALEATGWNVSKAAAQVGMQRPNFHAMMRKHGIRRDS